MIELLVRDKNVCSLHLEMDLNESGTSEGLILKDEKETIQQLKCEWLTIKDVCSDHMPQNKSCVEESFSKVLVTNCLLCCIFGFGISFYIIFALIYFVVIFGERNNGIF